MKYENEFIDYFKDDMISNFKNNLGKGYRAENLDKYGNNTYKDAYRMISCIIEGYINLYNILPTLEETIYVLINSFDYSKYIVDTEIELIKRLYEFHYDARI